MAAILWRGREFDARSSRIDCKDSGVTDADAVSLGELIKAGRFTCLETLWLVSDRFFDFFFCL
jgi:hypothetical protein